MGKLVFKMNPFPSFLPFDSYCQTSRWKIKFTKCDLVNESNARVVRGNLKGRKLDDNYDYFYEDYISNQANLQIYYISNLTFMKYGDWIFKQRYIDQGKTLINDLTKHLTFLSLLLKTLSYLN